MNIVLNIDHVKNKITLLHIGIFTGQHFLKSECDNNISKLIKSKTIRDNEQSFQERLTKKSSRIDILRTEIIFSKKNLRIYFDK